MKLKQQLSVGAVVSLLNSDDAYQSCTEARLGSWQGLSIPLLAVLIHLMRGYPTIYLFIYSSMSIIHRVRQIAYQSVHPITILMYKSICSKTSSFVCLQEPSKEPRRASCVLVQLGFDSAPPPHDGKLPRESSILSSGRSPILYFSGRISLVIKQERTSVRTEE